MTHGQMPGTEAFHADQGSREQQGDCEQLLAFGGKLRGGNGRRLIGNPGIVGRRCYRQQTEGQQSQSAVQRVTDAGVTRAEAGRIGGVLHRMGSRWLYFCFRNPR